MRIGFIYSGYSPGLHSGILRFERTLFDHLNGAGHTVARLEYPIRSGIPELWQQYARMLRPLAISAERRFIREFRPDLLIIQGAGYPEGRSLRWYPVPTIIVQHGYPDTPLLAPLINTYARTFGRWAFSRALQVVAISQYTRQKIRPFVTPNKYTVIHSSTVDSATFSPINTKTLLRKKYGIPVVADVLISVGRLVGIKNQSVLIRALKQLPDRTRLLFVGDGPDRRRLKGLARWHGVDTRVQFFGVADTDATLNELLNLSDLFVHPSLAEGLGLAPLEAMSAGVPVVSTGVGGLQEFIHDHETALVVTDPRDPQEWAQRIMELLNDAPAKEALSMKARSLVLEQFTKEVMCQQWDKLLIQLKSKTLK